MKQPNENDRKILCALQDGACKTGELARALDLNPRTIAKRSALLRGQGLLECPKSGEHRLTAQGERLLEEMLSPREMGVPALEAVVEHFPVPAMRAFYRLTVSALVAKEHLFDRYETGWPSFIVGGPTKTGKTLTARLVAKSLDRSDLIKHVQTATLGELIGRRVSTSGGVSFEPSPYVSFPFICLDELDKAQKPLQRQALYYLQGDSSVTLEGVSVPIRPISFVTLNTEFERGLSIIHEAYLRRSVVLDTSSLRSSLSDIDQVAERALRAARPFELSSWRPLKTKLSDRERETLRFIMKENLTEVGWNLFDVQPLALMALGRSALVGSLDAAIYQTAYDYLLCVETVNQTRPKWRGRLEPPEDVSGEESALSLEVEEEPFPEAVAPLAEAVKDDRLEKEEAGGVFIERRSRCVEGFSLFVDRLMQLQGKEWKRRTKPLRDKLAHYRDRARKIAFGDEDAIGLLEQLLERVRPEVEAHLADWELEESRRRTQDEERKKAAEEARSRKRIASECRRYLKRKRTRPDEDVLGELIRLGCVKREIEEYEETIEPNPVAEFIVWTAEGVRKLVPKWERYSVDELRTWYYGWDLEKKQFALEVFQALNEGSSSVRDRGDGTVEVQREREPLEKPEPKTVKRKREVLRGIDGKVYQREQLNRWEVASVREVLSYCALVLIGFLLG